MSDITITKPSNFAHVIFHIGSNKDLHIWIDFSMVNSLINDRVPINTSKSDPSRLLLGPYSLWLKGQNSPFSTLESIPEVTTNEDVSISVPECTNDFTITSLVMNAIPESSVNWEFFLHFDATPIFSNSNETVTIDFPQGISSTGQKLYTVWEGKDKTVLADFSLLFSFTNGTEIIKGEIDPLVKITSP